MFLLPTLLRILLLPFTNSLTIPSTTFSRRPLLPRLSMGHQDHCNSLQQGRRDGTFLASMFPFLQGNKTNAVHSSTITKPLADLPMIRLRLPKGAVGQDCVLVKVKVQDKGPYNFMVDSGLTTELITPHLQNILGINESKGKISAVAAGGGNESEIVILKDLSLCSGNFLDPSAVELKLPPLIAAVTDFPIEHMDPEHDPVEGMIGMEMLEYFDCDFDFPSERLKLWKPGTINTAGLVEIPAAVINETGLIAIRVVNEDQQVKQPVAGILDCGATFSIIKWAAAKLIGLSTSQTVYSKTTTVTGMGVDGKPILMPMVPLRLSFVGSPKSGEKNNADALPFEVPPTNWKPWSIHVDIGEIPAFSNLLGGE